MNINLLDICKIKGLIKNPAFFRDRVMYFLINYFWGAGACVCGADNGAVLFCCGAKGVPTGAWLIRLSLEFTPPDFGINKVEVRHNTPIIAAKSQVPFSSTSVVCFTPISWLLNPPSDEDKPPPLGF